MKVIYRGILYIFIGVVWLGFSISATVYVFMKYLNDDVITSNFFYMAGSVIFMFICCLIILIPIICMINDYVNRESRGWR